MGYGKFDYANCTVEEWRNEDRQLHRVGGPAKLCRDSRTGVITSEYYYVNGKFHRVGGPAVLWRNSETGVVEVREFWENDVLLDSWYSN